MDKLAAEVSNDVKEVDICTLSDVWDHYSHLLEEFDIDLGTYHQHKNWFKEKLEKLLIGHIDFVPQLDPHQTQLLFSTGETKVLVQTLKKKTDELCDEQAMNDLKASQFSDTETEELLALYHTSLHIRGDIRASPGHNNCAAINKEDALKIIPESLFMSLSILLKGDIDDLDKNSYMEGALLSISQEIVFAMSKRKKLTSKHIGLGVAIHQAMRSKSLQKNANVVLKS